MNTKRLAINAILLSLLIISAFIKIPTALIPFTLQLLMVLIISLITKPLDGFLIYLTYIIIGLVGIPVFASGGGLGYVYLPSFGFILGFLVMHLVMVVLKEALKAIRNNYLKYFSISTIGLVTLYTVGVSYAFLIFNVHNSQNYSLLKILQMMVTPFLLFDLVKCLIAAFFVIRLKNLKIFDGAIYD